MENNHQDSLKGLTHELLRDALKNAELILAYAAERGLDIKKSDIKTLVEAKIWEEKSEWNSEREIEFWVTYKTISKQIQPITISSLRASKKKRISHPNWWQKIWKTKYKTSLAHKAVTRYTIVALIAMVLMLIIQIYALKGTTLLNNIQSSNQEMQIIENRLSELILIIGEDGNNRSAVLEKTQLEIKNEELAKEVASSTELLNRWIKMMNFISFRSQREVLVEKYQNKDTSLDSLPNPLIEKAAIDKNIMIIQEAKNFTVILSMYLLPLLYGLLGGFAYVLRNLANETKNLVFSAESNIKYMLRIHLGALAGLTIGLLWGDIEKQQFIASLSPLAISFVAGYSVEFVFSFVDKIIEMVAKKKEPTETPNVTNEKSGSEN